MIAAPFPGLRLRPLAGSDESELKRIRLEPEVLKWWGPLEPEFPREEPESTRWTVELDGSVVGMVQFWEETEPRYRYATIDLFLQPAVHGRGVGTEVVAQVVRHLIEDRGHHRITIDPALTNAGAIRSYEKVGFTRVGVMRAYERDVDGHGWHDALLMELVTGLDRAGLGNIDPS
jgi:aminoglycoside 6'-N-acetyltransferase